MPFLSDLNSATASPPKLHDQLGWVAGGAHHSVKILKIHTVYLFRPERRTFVLLVVTSVMKNSDETVDDRFAFFSRDELLEQQDKLLRAEAELSNARQQLDMSSTARS